MILNSFRFSRPIQRWQISIESTAQDACEVQVIPTLVHL